MKKRYRLLLFILAFFFSTLSFEVYAGEYGDIDSFTTKQITPWMKKYHMTSPEQYGRGYKGGEGWQKIKSISADPFNEKRAVFGTDTSGIWTTVDGGTVWENTSFGFDSFGVLDVEYDPECEGFLYAVGYPGYSYKGNLACRIYVSENYGNTWRCVLDNIKVDEAQSKNNIISFKSIGKSYSAVYISLYNGGIIYSEDKGEKWETLGLEEYTVKGLELCKDTMYVLTDGDGILKSTDAGKSFTKLDLSVVLPDTDYKSIIPDEDVLDIALNPIDEKNIVFITSEYCVSSYNGGERWDVLPSLSKRWERNLVRVQFGASDKDGICALYVGGNLEKLRFSTDGGNTRIVSATDTSLHYNGEEGWYQNVFAISPANPDIVYAASAFEIVKSTDRGASFIASSGGYSGMRAVDFAFSPDNDYEYYFSFIDTGIAKSEYTNSGEQYPLMYYAGRDSGGIRYNKFKTSQAVAIDPKDTKRVLFSIGNGEETVIKETNDGGKSFTVHDSTVGECHEIAFNMQNHDVIYAGRYISRDNGKTWTDCGYEIRAVSPVDGNIVWGVKKGEFYKSSDGGMTWGESLGGIGGGNIKIVADSVDKNKLYICDYESGYRVVTADTIEKVDCGFICWAIAQDPHNPLHLVAGGTNAAEKRPVKGIYETYDGGETWYGVSGLTGSCDVWGMAFHPRLPRVFIGTSSGTFVYEYKEFTGNKFSVSDDGAVIVTNTSYDIADFNAVIAQYNDGRLKNASVIGKTALPFEKFTVFYPDTDVINPDYCVKYQSSDGKIWEVDQGANYNLLYTDNAVMDSLYSSISLESLDREREIECAYLVTSTVAGIGFGNNSWTNFRIEECTEVSAATLPGGLQPSELPVPGDVIVEDVFTDSDVNKYDNFYNIIDLNVFSNPESKPNYMSFDVTDYVRKKVENSEKNMFFRLSLMPINGQDYNFAINNAWVNLFVRYKNSALPDSEKKLYIWESISGMKPVCEAIRLQ